LVSGAKRMGHAAPLRIVRSSRAFVSHRTTPPRLASMTANVLLSGEKSKLPPVTSNFSYPLGKVYSRPVSISQSLTVSPPPTARNRPSRENGMGGRKGPQSFARVRLTSPVATSHRRIGPFQRPSFVRTPTNNRPSGEKVPAGQKSSDSASV